MSTGNEIKEDGVHLLCDSLQYNSTLTSLYTECKQKKGQIAAEI